MATTRFIDHLLEGDHASRPSAGSVPQGTLYACSTHTIVYQSDGTSTWSNWFVGATGMTDPMTTRGDIIVRNASNVTARLAKGGSGTYLGSDGTDVGYSAVTDAQLSTSDITTNNASTSKHGFLKKLSNSATDYMDGSGNWSTPAGAGGGWPMLEAHTANNTSSNLDFTSFISSTYDVYFFTFIDVLAATDNVGFGWRAGTGGGPTYDTGANYTNVDSFTYVNSDSGEGVASQTAGTISGSVKNATLGVTGFGYLFDPQGTTHGKAFVADTNNTHTSVGFIQRRSGVLYTPTTALTAIRFFTDSGNITSGTIRVYGIPKT